MTFWRARRSGIIAFVVLLAGTIGIGYPLWNLNNAQRAAFNYAFPQLQDARTSEDAKTILTTWNEKGANDEIRRAMQIDLVFPFFYASLLALLAYRASVARPTPWVAHLGRWLAVAALLGGLADLGENSIMLGMLGHPELAASVSVKNVFYCVKLAGAYAALLYLVLCHVDTQRDEPGV